MSYRTKRPDICWGKSNIALLRRNIICIRGTNTIWDMISDANIIQTKSSCKKVNFHKGFYKSAMNFVNLVENNDFLKKYKYFDICGHSAGGSIGVIAAYELNLRGYNVGNVVSFGSPKVTDKNGCEILEDAINYTRITCNDDIFVDAPPNIFGYKYNHFGKHVHIDNTSNNDDFHNIFSIHSMQNYDNLLENKHFL